MAKRQLNPTIDKTVSALETLVSDPSTPALRAAAEALVTLRSCFTHQDQPDWTGRSPEYRDLIERLYRQVGMPSDSEGNLQASLRYHVGAVLRDRAPTDQLQNLGLAVSGPLGRLHDRRAAARTKDTEATDVRARRLLRELRQLRTGDLTGLTGTFQSIIAEAAAAMADSATSNVEEAM